MEDVSTFGRVGSGLDQGGRAWRWSVQSQPGAGLEGVTIEDSKRSDRHTSRFEILEDETGGDEEVEISRDQKRWDGRMDGRTVSE